MKNDEIKRVKDNVAEDMVKKEGWIYVPKKKKATK